MEQENKSQIWIWVAISIATVLVVVVAAYFVLNKIDPKESVSVNQKPDSPTFGEQYLDSMKFEIDLQKNYVGTKTDNNGSVNALLLQIKNVNKQLNSFDYVLNVGVQSRNSASGTIDFNKATIYSTEFGELTFRVDSVGRILLNNKDKNIYPKFELSEEIK